MGSNNTTDWEDIAQFNSGNFGRNFSSFSAGDKLRCVLKCDGKIRYYTNSITFKNALIFPIRSNTNNSSKDTNYSKSDHSYSTDYDKSHSKSYDWKYYWEEEQKKKTGFEFDNMTGPEFERYCANLLRSNGFVNVRVTQISGDYGVDIIAEKDTFTYAIQCKRFSNNVGKDAVSQVFSGKVYYGCDFAVVMTNRYFTKSATEMAKKLKVHLWDRDYILKFRQTGDNFRDKSSYSHDDSYSKYYKNSQESDKWDYRSQTHDYSYDKTQTSYKTYSREEIIKSVVKKYSYFEECRTVDEIKKLYRDLAKEYHPDVNEDKEVFKEISFQYDKLKKELHKVLSEYEKESKK